jgi:cytochrome c-type biogenesis protein CcmH/NrfG
VGVVGLHGVAVYMWQIALVVVVYLQSSGVIGWAESSSQPTLKQAAVAPAKMPGKPAIMAPIELSTEKKTLDLTDDIARAEAQAAAYPNDPEAQFLLAVAYSRSPYIEKALQVLQRTKRLIKNRADRLETVERLTQDYEAALTQRPNDTRILYRLAFGYYLKGMGLKKYQQVGLAEQLEWVHKAQATLKQVIALDPTDVAARNYLGFIVAEEGTDTQKPDMLPMAITMWQQSLAVNPVNPGAYWLLGQAYLKQGNLLKAAQHVEKGIQARHQIEHPTAVATPAAHVPPQK